MSAQKKLERSRRSFLTESVSSLGGLWVIASYPGIVAAAEHVRNEVQAGRTPTFAFFTPEQAVEVEAVAAQIIPTDDTPGAREARVVSFIDRVLVTFERDLQPAYTEGLEDLAVMIRQRFPSAGRFTELTFDQQLEVLSEIEDTTFFNMLLTHVITGFFASPLHDSLQHEPPFGYYDALPQINQ
jgi:gluconate 2-dehydrogenase gamma chain